jgi:GDPmannose 4,6-dehydratase
MENQMNFKISKDGSKRALITGVCGQDGSFLADLLLDKGYEVFGFARQGAGHGQNNAYYLDQRVKLLFGDVSSVDDIKSAIDSVEPNEIYNLAAQSLPSASWEQPLETLQVNGSGPVRLFEVVRRTLPTCRVFQASSSEMYGATSISPQNEQTPFNPLSPYAAAKLYAHEMAKIYRDSYGLYIACGILFNHESERRSLRFLTQKVAYGAACAALGIKTSPDLNEVGRPIVQDGKLALGNLEIARDWGAASDFVHAMWLILQQDQPHDFVIGTGRLSTLKDLCVAAYGSVGRDWRESVVSDPALLRPLEFSQTLADPTKASSILGWKPLVSFDEMVKRMVDAQIFRLNN